MLKTPLLKGFFIPPFLKEKAKSDRQTVPHPPLKNRGFKNMSGFGPFLK